MPFLRGGVLRSDRSQLDANSLGLHCRIRCLDTTRGRVLVVSFLVPRVLHSDQLRRWLYRTLIIKKSIYFLCRVHLQGVRCFQYRGDNQEKMCAVDGEVPVEGSFHFYIICPAIGTGCVQNIP